jgi:septal ring factor EnvC (AmiA/AmiB activator)
MSLFNNDDLKKPISYKMALIMIMVCLIFCFQVFVFFTNGNQLPKVNYIKKEITELKDEIKSVYKTQELLNQKIDTFNLKIKEIHQVVSSNNVKLENLKKDEKIQIDNFKSYDASMYERYFAERYTKNKVPDTIK